MRRDYSQGWALDGLAMPAERRPKSEDPADLIARVSARKRAELLRVHRHRLGRADLEDCYSQATLALVVRARTRERAFMGEHHVANAVEQRLLSRITDRVRAIGGRSPIEAATQEALSQNHYQVEDLALAFGELAQLAGCEPGAGRRTYSSIRRRVIVGARCHAEEAPDLRGRVEACRLAFVGRRDGPRVPRAARGGVPVGNVSPAADVGNLAELVGRRGGRWRVKRLHAPRCSGSSARTCWRSATLGIDAPGSWAPALPAEFRPALGTREAAGQ